MPQSGQFAFRFGVYVADLRSCELYREGTKTKLQEQPFKVLAVLLERAGETVTREELREKLWPCDTFVDFDHGINVAVAKLRDTLCESSEQPQFIETVGRRGYRFITPVERVWKKTGSVAPSFSTNSPAFPAPRHSVGREKERAGLAAAFTCAAAGRGALACVAGEPGIGKTTLVQDFLAGLDANGKSFGLAIGRCSQRLAGEEAYLPFLEALESLARSGGGVRSKLRELAPSWYAQLFPLSESEPFDAALLEYARSTTQERVKRELATFLSEITRQEPLVLFFDDVHWTDPSTVDLLAHLATNFDGTKILVIVTYRPSELLLLKHPFIAVKREIQTRGLCYEIEVEFLSAGDVERYISLAFLGNSFPREFAGLVHAKTEGNALFMVDLLRYLRDRKIIVKADGNGSWLLARSLPDLSRDIPQSVNSVIQRKIDQLSERDQEVLTAAAIQGYECDSASVARALKADGVEVEEILDRLDRVFAFVKRVGEDELPSGVLTVRYRFVHALYQNALNATLTPGRRIALCAAVAEALESSYGDKSATIASNLGFLYETARNPERALDYFSLAAQAAQQIFANREAIGLARRGLALVAKIPESPERTRKDLHLQMTLAFSLLWTQGYASHETGINMTRARELCESLGDTASLFPIIFGLFSYYLCKGDVRPTRETAEHLYSIANNLDDNVLRIGAYTALGFTAHHEGELQTCCRHFEEVSRLHDASQHRRYVQLYRYDPCIHAACERFWTLWLLGFPDQARQKMEEAFALARAASSPLSLTFCQLFATYIYENLGLPEKTIDTAAACIALCEEHGIMLERTWVECVQGWAMVELGDVEKGLSQIHGSLEMQLALGAQIARPHFQAIAGKTLWRVGQAEAGLQAVADGLAVSDRNGEKTYDAELWRLRGELLKMQGSKDEVECCFQKAIDIASNQAAKSLELRASTSLARFWGEQGKVREAREMLGEIYSWFTEGLDSVDLREASSVLENCS